MDGASESELVDTQVLLALRDFRVPGEPDPALEVARVFLEVTPTRLQAVQQAAEHGDLAEVQRVAHTLRGSCSTVGASAMYGAANELEAASLTSALMLIARLEVLFARTAPVLDALARDV